MYNDFFGLDRNPFELSPDPSFMCSTEKSNAALTAITYAITNRKGFVVMTGDVGTGKTLIVRSLFECWKSQGIAFANIFAPKLPLIDFLINATSDLGIKVTESTKGNLLRAFYGFLVTQFQKGLTTVLVIDEAHQMPAAVLEEIRMLTNVETNQQKLIQVLLVGQPELDRKLDSFELRQLKQRIATRCRLEPLTEEETRHYVTRRLDLAGAKSQANTIFPTETVGVVYRYSQGIPRLINSICEQALIAACTLQLSVVPVRIIEEVASLFRLDPAPNLKQTEKAVPVESRQAVPLLKVSAMKGPDTDTSLRHVSAGCGTPVQVPLPSSDYTDTNRVTIPSKARLLESGSASTLATESILLGHASTQLKACEPAIDQTAAALPNPRATLRSGKILLNTSPSQLCRRSVPILRRSRFFYAAAVVAVTAAVIMPGRQNGVVIVPRQIVSAWEGSPAGPTAAPMRSAETSAAIQFNSGTMMLPSQTASARKDYPVGPTAAPIQPGETSSASRFNRGSADPIAAQRDREISKPAVRLEHLQPRAETAISTLSRPVSDSPYLSTSTEPPPIMGTQIDESLGHGLFGISVPGPTPPAASAGGYLEPPKLVSSPPISASSLARAGKMQGVAVIDALVDSTGKVIDMKVISGSPRLTTVAKDALRTWKYEPAQLNGQPIAMRVKVSINFRRQ